jgi:O-antigen/teichoic acid export membrane protein
MDQAGRGCGWSGVIANCRPWGSRLCGVDLCLEPMGNLRRNGKERVGVVRRALVMAAGEQYCRLAIQFASIVIVSRLLTPAEIGISVIGMGIMVIAIGLREFATSDFLIQRPDVSQDDIRTSFTLLFLLTALISGALFVGAPWLGGFYGEDGLASFLRVVAVGTLIEALALPIRGVLRRDMAFGTLALINTTAALVLVVTTILLALAGFSFMSTAWATLAAAATTALLSFHLGPKLSGFRPTLKSWRSVLSFGGYHGASYVIGQVYDSLPQLVLGTLLPPSSVGLYNRAVMVSKIPQMVFLTSVFDVAFPALAAQIRRGGSLKEPYLRAVSYITAAYWPAIALVVLLAHPLVALLLGQQWLGVIPLLQIIAFAYLAWFPDPLTTPVLLAVGANRDRAMVLFLGRSVSLIALCFAASFGIMAMAASQLVIIPYMMVVALYYVRRHIAFEWRELGAALWKSLLVTGLTVAGPIGVVALWEASFELSIAATTLAVLLAAVGWLGGVLLTRHPILVEFRKVSAALAEAMRHRLRERLTAPAPRVG